MTKVSSLPVTTSFTLVAIEQMW